MKEKLRKDLTFTEESAYNVSTVEGLALDQTGDTQMAYKTFDLATAETSYNMDVYGKDVVIVKVKTARWLLCDTNGVVICSKRSEAEVLTQAAKIEERRCGGNLHGFRFGGKIDSSVVVDYAAQVWGKLFTLDNVQFKDAHYWVADITHTESGISAKQVRADYFINYMRAPDGTEFKADVINRCKEFGARDL